MKNVYLIPTDKPSRLLVRNDKPFVLMLKEHSPFATNQTHTYQNIYIISSEEIKELDWCINTKRINEKINFPDKIIGKADYTANVLIGSSWKKIILTTDQDLIKDGVQAIDDTFLEWFVNNPSCEEFKVIIEGYKKNGMIDESTSYKYKIIIPNSIQKN